MDTKRCIGCGQEKATTEFNFKVKRRGLRQSYCRDCSREQVRKHYEAHRKYYIRKARQRTNRVIQEHRERIFNYLAEHPCVDCGDTDPTCLDFDHVRGKKFSHVSLMVGRYSWEKIEEEIQKCEVRCASCHRKRTAQQRIASRRLLTRP